jgi:hypothetical protein
MLRCFWKSGELRFSFVNFLLLAERSSAAAFGADVGVTDSPTEIKLRGKTHALPPTHQLLTELRTPLYESMTHTILIRVLVFRRISLIWLD